MTKDVLLSISGLQFAMNSNQPVEMITIADYYNRNGKHYVLYEEMEEDSFEVTRNTIKVTDKSVDIMKKGATNTHMIFEEKKKNITYYKTPFGNLLVGLMANKIAVNESEEGLDIQVDYSLDINYEFVSDCSINISIKPKNSAQLRLN